MLLLSGSPSTCFGETLKGGTMRLAEFLLIKSVGLFVLFSIDIISCLIYLETEGEFFIIPLLLVVISMIKIACNIYLYIGARNGNPTYMKPWFWVYSIQTVLLMLFSIGGGLAMDFMFPRASVPAAFIFVLSLLYCMANKFFCQVVLGLIREMERGSVYSDNIRPVPFTNEIA